MKAFQRDGLTLKFLLQCCSEAICSAYSLEILFVPPEFITESDQPTFSRYPAPGLHLMSLYHTLVLTFYMSTSLIGLGAYSIPFGTV